MAPRLFPRSPGWRKRHTEIYRGSEYTVIFSRKPKLKSWSRTVESMMWSRRLHKQPNRQNLGGSRVGLVSRRAIPCQPLQNNILAGGFSSFSDLRWTNQPSRSYRLRSP